MRIRNRRTWAALCLLLVAGGYAAYEAALHWRCNSCLQAAQEALEQHDFLQASLYLKQCLDSRPKDLAARMLAARAARHQGKFGEAHLHLTYCKGKKWLREALKLENRLLAMQQGDVGEAD